MKISIYLLIVTLAILESCGGNKSSESEQDSTAIVSNPHSTATGHTHVRPVGVSFHKVSDTDAQTYYSRYSAEVKAGRPPINMCPDSTTNHKLRYVRVLKDSVLHHIGINDSTLPINDPNLPAKFVFDGIRLYPCIYIDGSIQYLLVFTQKLSSNAHKDVPRTFFRVVVNGTETIDWCGILKLPMEHTMSPMEYTISKKDVVILTAHHLCEPTCSSLDRPLLSF